jgi:hypothetical protein
MNMIIDISITVWFTKVLNQYEKNHYLSLKPSSNFALNAILKKKKEVFYRVRGK